MIESGEPVQDISINEGTSIDKIFEKMSKSGGFESRNLADGLSVLTEMISDKECINFLSFVGAVISTGLRGIIKVKRIRAPRKIRAKPHPSTSSIR